MRRWRVAIVSAGCVAAMLLTWLSFEVPPPWPWWIRGAALLAVPVAFFGAIAVELSVAASRAERGLSPEEKRLRRRSAWEGVARDVGPVLSRPDLYVRPLGRAWDLWRSPHPPREDGSSGRSNGK